MGSNKRGDNNSCKEKVRGEENREEETWMKEKILRMMEERRKYKQAGNEERKRRYRELRNQVRKDCKKAREEWINQNCKDIEEKMKEGKTDRAYSM
ncbi:hypothetical protein PGB90_003915 [Kerria lacca]